MTPNDFKKLLNEALEPIKQKQENHSAALIKITTKLDSTSADLTKVTTKQDVHSAALISIESKLDAYGDMYKINDSNVRKVEKRLETLEENADIIPPSEFVLASVS